MRTITVLIPCYNEEHGIGKVIDAIPYAYLENLGYGVEVIVVDNNSTDDTVKYALEKGACVISEPNKGKGNAIRTGFNAVIDRNTSIVVMLDGDNSYNAGEIPRLIEPLTSNFSDVIIGSRLGGRIHKNSLKLQNRIANWFYTFLARHFFRANTTDVLSGYFAWKKEVIIDLLPYLTSEGFAIEMEMTAKIVKLGYEIHSVPISYKERVGESKISAIEDGIKILHAFFKNLYWSPKKAKPQNSKKETKFITHTSLSY